MDRSVLEGDPHSVIEAMTIAGYAIGSNQGYVYVRAEYPLAIERLSHAIEQAREYKFLGKNIFEKPFDFDLEIRIGAGAFVCGEETALMTSIEGKRGEPRPRPPFPAVAGLWKKPTLLNNVETYATIPPIILKGAEWYSQFGTGCQPGHESLRPGRGHQQRRAGGDPHGDLSGEIDLRCGRRNQGREEIQSRPDRGPFGRLHPQGAPEHLPRLRIGEGRGGHHGIGRPHRHGREHLHGRPGPVLHGLHPG